VTFARFFALAALLWALPALAQRYSDEEIRKILIYESTRTAGECPCPYSYAWNGRQCADNSQYSRTLGGARPLCYPNDVKYYMIRDYRERVLR
jgi:hypothetical protein